MISHERKCIFIHIPKTAGTSIEKKLGFYDGFPTDVSGKLIDRRNQDHRTLREVEPIALSGITRALKPTNIRLSLKNVRDQLNNQTTCTEEQYQSYFKFAIVRNPWARAASWYKNVIRDDIHRARYGIPEQCTYADFLNVYGHQYALNPQMYWLKDRSGNIPLDFVGRFEHLDKEFTYICESLGFEDTSLPHFMKGDGRSYVDYYNQETIDLIAKKYKEEIAHFNYEFGA